MGDLLDGYDAIAAWDEMFDGDGSPRPHYRTLYEQVQTSSRADFDERCTTRDRVFRDRGITFAYLGEERPFPLDLVPRVVSAAEWATIEAGVRQRVRALERFLADVYTSGAILREGIVPRRLVVTSTHFHRAVFGIDPPGKVRVHVAGIDLVRDGDGRLCVLEDNLRTPSGISYVVENRRAMTHVFPELFASHRVRPVSDYPTRLLGALRATAPPGRVDPNVVVFTPGVHNAAYFEHSFLARQMDHEIGIRPTTRMLRYVDYWGTKVTAFDVHEPHERLVVHGRSLVETGLRPGVAAPVSWEVLTGATCYDEFHEFLGPSPFVPHDPQFAAIATEITAGLDPRAAVQTVAEWTRSHLAYERGSTTVRTTATEALALARGVCQDFVHVALGLLRARGIPARYASGYLHPEDQPTIGDRVLAESHAWLDAWIGGWHPVDPTNGAPVAERHVRVARGRDYSDVTPFKGVYHGPSSEGVSVQLR